jgi:hypothetical protein
MEKHMDAMMPVLLMAGVLAAAVVAFVLARRFGVPLGLVLPMLVVAAALWRLAMPPGHAEEAMGRGIETVLIWMPLLALTVIGAGLGFVSRRKGRRG